MNTFFIVDGNSIANRAFYGVPPLTTKDGTPTNAVVGFLNMLKKLIGDGTDAYLAVAFDERGKVFRHEKFVDYKANRKGMPDDLAAQMPLIREVLTLMQVPILSMPGYEGDDILGTLGKKAKAAGFDVALVSGDRDTFQLIEDHIKVIYPRRGLSDTEVMDLPALKEKYDLSPTQIIDLKGLMGDASDNIPGVPGVGVKTATKFLQKYGSMEGLYDHIEDFDGKKMGDKLTEYKDQAFMSRDLATITTDVPLEIPPMEAFRLKEPDLDGLRAFYSRLELRQFLNQLDEGRAPEAQPEGEVHRDLAAIRACLDDLADADQLVIICRLDDGRKTLTDLALRGKGTNHHIPCADHEAEVAEGLANLLQAHDKPVITDDAKAFYTALALCDIKAVPVAWDAVLSDYLLDPESGDHSLEGQLQKRFQTVFSEDPSEKYHALLEGLEKLQEPTMEALREADMADLYYALELPLAQVLVNMEQTGVRLNIPYLQAMEEEFAGRLDKLTNDIYDLAGEPFNINSPKQLGQVLFDQLGLPVLKKTKTGPSTNAEVLDQLRKEHPIVPLILDYRQLSKLKSTYIDGLLALADEEGKVYTHFNQTLTATGRLSSSEPNLQNIPVRTEEGRRIRQAFIPSEEGQVLISADYSQIELRILAAMSLDGSLVNSFRSEEDIHRRTASEVFHVPIDQVTSLQRYAAKAVNFGIIYGQTDFGLARELGISRKAAQEYIDKYFERYPLVQKWIDEAVEAARENGYVKTILGRRRYIRDIHSKNQHQRHFAERTAVNAPIQGSAADVIKLAMLDVNRRLEADDYRARMLLQVHDELIFEAPPEEAGMLIQMVHEAMEEVLELPVPLHVEVKVGFNWEEMETV
ncbi:DNA polymerase I [Peptococcus simiae]|uniref:DNA polymerase I n=1 Tax=Peptococcus simiae TaxID=1643805 RepID=A0ABW9H004_9FIRM